jgi:hypothetical protein
MALMNEPRLIELLLASMIAVASIVYDHYM